MVATVTIGDILVSITVALGMVGTYYAMKGRLQSVERIIRTFTGRMDAHGNRLNEHARALNGHGQRIARVEGRVFGRRIGDATNDEHQLLDSEDL